MKKNLLRLCAMLISLMIFSQSIYAADMTSEEAGAYLSEIIKLIDSTYISENGGEVDKKALVEAAIAGMASTLDEYSGFYNSEQYAAYLNNYNSEIYGMGIEYDVNTDGYPYLTEVYSGGAAENEFMLPNDIIISIDGKSMLDISQAELEAIIHSPVPKTLNLTYKRRKNTRTRLVEILKEEVKTVSYCDAGSLIGTKEKTTSSRTGYIKISALSSETATEFKEALSALKKMGSTRLILDLRGNSGGYVEPAISICQSLVPKGTIVVARSKSGEKDEYLSYLEECPFKSMAVLVDGMTASAAEIIASAIQDSGAGIVVGEKTYGKGIMQDTYTLEGMGILKLTAYEYYSRNGKKVNLVGITPDIEIKTVLFIDKSDTIESEKVKTALDFLGYDVKNETQILKSIGLFQQNQNLNRSYKLDAVTISTLNVCIYKRTREVDRALISAYNALLK